MAVTQVVGILGGMGPAAGADFVRLFVLACAQQMRARGEPVRDQSFPEHWLAQVPVPDRTDALASAEQGAHQPLEPMLQALGRLAALGSRAVAIACNTAHAWHANLQERFPQVELLHMARETAQQLAGQGTTSVALMATEGTYRVRLYEQALAEAGLGCHVPTPAERHTITRGIFDGVKAGNMQLAEQCFSDVALRLAERHGPVTIIMGCTEVPLGLQGSAAVAGLDLVDPAQVLAAALARRAYQPH
ncbi:aspartate racemase [Variovorax sp. YR634]|jgi:aspartate racemase|uniref:aspartate/glutamate racemase family protein n=1 Tax=Variovorax TaxID=34072 RepID=UPI000899ABC6|nr:MULTISPECIES: amino acid racemase [Variovorax]MDQ0083236.1 aspartate racemase [Variovorax boronicumulans]SDW45671.1 aspartate racemase [Variovorax sp. YR634]SDY05529.1 aspartate racemase [Variovorax sp. YR266]